jgi:ribosomal protein L40E
MNCPNYRTDNPEGYGIGRDCGQSPPPERVCYNCHHPNPSHRKFCRKCGATLIQLPSQLRPLRFNHHHSVDHGLLLVQEIQEIIEMRQTDSASYPVN